jgi:hypothetical protein
VDVNVLVLMDGQAMNVKVTTTKSTKFDNLLKIFTKIEVFERFSL